MAFFDEGDEPPTRAQRPRPRSSGGGGGPRGGGGAVHADAQAIRQRRLIALAFGVLVFIVLAFGVNACLDSRAKNRVEQYNRDVASVITDSDRNVSRPFFQTIAQGGQSPVELESQVNQLRGVADGQVDQAEGFDVPDELRDAQHNLLLALSMRASALGKIAGEVRTALADGEQSSRAVNQIAAQMQQFLASDVIYDTRVVPFLQEVLEEKKVGDRETQAGQFLPNLDWLQPNTVGTRLGAETTSDPNGDAAADDQNVAPGLHGHGLVSVAVGDTALQPGESVNRIPAGSNISFRVTFANQGDNNERNVAVTVRIRGSGVKTVTERRRVPQTTAGANAEATIPLKSAPPIGQAVRIEVSVARVPGEEKTDNNTQTYPAIFTS